MSAVRQHAFVVSRIPHAAHYSVADSGISSGLPLIANRNKKNIQTRLPLGDLG
jgi:hypothetical protein